MNNNKGMSKKEPRIWNGTEEALLKKWGEQAASYRILHNRAYRKYKWLTAIFTIPVIIISTLTGTANFSQGTIVQIYPSFEMYLPLMIGALNLISGIITTIGQFLRVSELNEAHRNSSISYGKFARNISTELSLPPNERTYSGLDFIQICRNEMDRLIEQSPEIGMEIITKFEKNKKFKNIIKPEVINISSIVPYKPTKDEKTQETLANAAGKFRKGFLNNKLNELQPDKDSSSKFKQYDIKRNVELELAEIRDKKLSSSNQEHKEKINNILKQSIDNNPGLPNMNKINNLFNNKNNDSHVVNMNNIKNNAPSKKILSLAELVSKDNINNIKNSNNDETQTLEEFEIPNQNINMFKNSMQSFLKPSNNKNNDNNDMMGNMMKSFMNSKSDDKKDGDNDMMGNMMKSFMNSKSDDKERW